MFSSSTDNFSKIQKNDTIQNEIVYKSDEKNLNIYNRLRFSTTSGAVICKLASDVKEKKAEEATLKMKTDDILNINRDHLNDIKPIQIINSSDEENSCVDENFIQKSMTLQNLISSFPEIPESFGVSEEKEDANSEKSITSFENQCGFKDISGLSDVKNTLLSVFIYPSIFPQLFPKNIRWNQILLYGPPGTGKSMLAKAIATEINADLHRISSADLLSHWQGETEKQIRNIFAEVRSSPDPVVLFFDEIDGLCRKRTNTEDDSVRRIKAELLTQLDDFMSEFETHQTYIIGATNCPWEIDSGFMRRFHKRIFIPLPDKEARLDILKKKFDDIETELSDSEWDDIGISTEGYSGSDLVNVVMTSCCERFMQMKKSEYWEAKGNLWFPAEPFSWLSLRMNFEDIPPDKVGCRKIIFTDLKAGIANTPKTVEPEELFKYLEFSSKIK